MLGNVIDVLLRLLHPLTPFVTETLWTALTGQETVVTAPWPVAEPAWADPDAEAAVGEVQHLVTEVRRFRNDQGLKPRRRVAARIAAGADGAVALHEVEIRSLTWLDRPGDGFAPTASLHAGAVRIDIDTSDAIDVGAERRRLDKDLAAARKELAQAAAKLDNEQFLAKAPEAVIARIRDRRVVAEADIARLEGQLAALPG